MDCPRCGTATAEAQLECPSCGVVIAKARPGPLRPGRLAPPSQSVPGPPAWRPLLLPGLGLALIAVVAFASMRTRPPATDPPAAPGSMASPPRSAPPLPELRVDASQPPRMDTGAIRAALGATDAAEARGLVARLESRATIEPADLAAAERLFELSPMEAAPLLSAVLAQAAAQRRARHEYDRAADLLERAVVLQPAENEIRRALLAVRVEQGDWPRVEAVASDILGRAPSDGGAKVALAHALVRQDRSREALEMLTRYLDHLERSGGRDTAGAAALHARLRHDLSIESPLHEHTLAHFNVRYDGAAHEEVGRAILLVLERHYATLAATFSRPPRGPIPVVLLSESSYYGASGAPAWSGGQFDSFNGGVRMPIGGLSSALSPELEQVLMHELTHAFVTECSAGLAPRILQEGLAQMMEGHRLEADLGPEGMSALAQGRIGGVEREYLVALGFVEHLVAQRGQGGINDLLQAMSRTRDVDAAFRQVHGRDLAELQADWARRLQQRYGG